MKTLNFLLTLVLLTSTSIILKAQTFSTITNKFVNIPDESFKKTLLSNEYINQNNDNYISFKEAKSYTGLLDVSDKGIKDLTGIEAFTNISYLNVNNNLLTELNLQNNLMLEHISCTNNSIQTLDLSYLPELTVLICKNNIISTINVSTNELLMRLDVSYNLLTDLYVSENSELRVLNCSNNSIAYLDMSDNNKLVSFNCSNNKLSTLNMANQNNTAIQSISMKNNALNCIQVDDKKYAQNNWSDFKDYKAYFSVNCNTIETPTTTYTSEVSVFPNPATDGVNINLGTIETDVNLLISNSQGRVVMNKQYNEADFINLNLDLSSGVYFVNIKSESGLDKTTQLIVK